MHKILTTDQTLLKNPEYLQIRDTLLRLANNGVIRMGQGWCVSMSDMIYTLLKQQGISAKMVECQATVTQITQDGEQHLALIGFDAPDNEGQIAGHVVLVTMTTPPMIIDASIGHVLPQDQSVIVDACLGTQTHRVFAEIRTDTLKITYQEKAQPKIPLTHQVSVLDRIVTDQKIFSDISMLKKLNYIGIALSIFAAVNVIGKLLGVF